MKGLSGRRDTRWRRRGEKKKRVGFYRLRERGSISFKTKGPRRFARKNTQTAGRQKKGAEFLIRGKEKAGRVFFILRRNGGGEERNEKIAKAKENGKKAP